jgi:hypothetical protein
MPGMSLFLTPGRVKNINLLCLLLAICCMLFLPLKKEMWYDESVSVLISKGISHDSPAEFANLTSITSDTLHTINNFGNVFHATIVDNGNSFLYNECLHWFTGVFGNNISIYLLFSKLCGVASLIAFFFLCGLLFDGNLFTSISLILFASDKIFWGMGHEIRAYQMGIFFVIMAVAYCYKFLYKAEKPVYLLLTGLFSVGAILCHYLSVYIVLVLISYLIAAKKTRLFAPKNLVQLLIPIAIIAVYFYFAYTGFVHMGSQNKAIKERLGAEGYSIVKAFFLSMKFTVNNFKVVFSSFNGSNVIILISFLLLACLYVLAMNMSTQKEQKRNLNFLMILGLSGSVFLALLSVKSQHYTALYARYYSFAVPFTSLFAGYALSIMFGNPKSNKVFAGLVATIIIIPCVLVYMVGMLKNKPTVSYNHTAIAKEIANNSVTVIEVPGWNEAFLVSGFMPKGYKVEYRLNAASGDFILHKQSGIDKIPLIRKDN